MPRLSRLDAPGVLHHVIGRGIERRKIFLNGNDYDDFIERLGEAAPEDSIDIYAWALMPNHFHLLVKTKNRPLSSVMRKLLTGYAVNFNKRHRRHGHLFQNRYKSIICQEDLYLKELVRYIHLNLLRGGRVKDFNELNRSLYSGHSVIMGKVKRKWQDTGYVLSVFGDRNRYLRYVEEGIELGRRPELVGGGLIRSMGGWSEVLALRKRGERSASDQRILGESDFVSEVITELDEQVKRNLRLSVQRKSIDDLAATVCNKYGISITELKSGSRSKESIESRRVVAWIGMRELGYSGAEIARYLGVTNSCITRIVSSFEKPDDVESIIHELCTFSTNVP